jgi:hypothetical protein
MREFKGHSIWWDEESGIVRAKAIGVIDEEAARFIVIETEKISQHHSEKVDWLIDLNQMTNATSKARKILAQASAHPSIRKYAFVGASIFIRTVANFVTSAAGQANTRHFANEEEALRWIKGSK